MTEHHDYRGFGLESEYDLVGFATVKLVCPKGKRLATFTGHSFLELRQTARSWVDKLIGKYGGEE